MTYTCTHGDDLANIRCILLICALLKLDLCKGESDYELISGLEIYDRLPL